MFPNPDLRFSPGSPFAGGNLPKTNPLIDYEMGGPDLGQTGGQLTSTLWQLRVEENDFNLYKEDSFISTVYTLPGVEEASLAFDQNMRPVLFYRLNRRLFLRWFNAVSNTYQIDLFGYGHSPCCSLDDKRSFALSYSSVIVAYIQNQQLLYRVQSERYENVHVAASGLNPNTKLSAIGMTQDFRFQFQLD